MFEGYASDYLGVRTIPMAKWICAKSRLSPSVCSVKLKVSLLGGPFDLVSLLSIP